MVLNKTLLKFKWQFALIFAVFAAATILFLLNSHSLLGTGPAKLDVSQYYSQTEVAIFIQSIQNGQLEKIKAHLNAGLSPNIEGAGGYRPLFFAVEAEQVEALKLLLDSGADPNTKLADGTSLYSYAKRKQNLEVLNILKNSGAQE